MTANRVAIVGLAAAALALLVPAVSHLREQPPPPPPAVRLFLSAPPGTELGAGDAALDAAISADQRQIVFVATHDGSTNRAAAGTTQLWRRRLDAERADPIAGTEGAEQPAWKATGNVVSFFADGRLKFVNLTTGTVSDVADAAAPAGASWERDGALLFAPGPGPIRRLRDGHVTSATTIAAGDVSHSFPMALDSGPGFIYVAVRDDGRRIVRLSTGSQTVDLTTTTAHAALIGSEPRRLLFVKDDVLFADELIAEGTALTGGEVPVAFDIGATSQGRGLFAASADILLHAGAAERPRQVAWLDMTGRPAGVVSDSGNYWQVRLSPDDRYVAVTMRDPLLRSLDVIMMSAGEPAPMLRLTTSLAADTDPVWSPDVRRVLFRSMQRGRPELFVTRATPPPPGALLEDPEPANTVGEVATDWRDREMLVQVRTPAGYDLVRVHEMTGRRTPVADSPFSETGGRWSPDGRWVAFVSDESGRPDIHVVNDRGRQLRAGSGGGTHPRWTRDGRALLFLRGSTVMRADLTADDARFEPPRPLFDAPGLRDFDVGHRSDRVIALVAGGRAPVTNVPVVLNWRSVKEDVGDRSKPKRQERPRPVL